MGDRRYWRRNRIKKNQKNNRKKNNIKRLKTEIKEIEEIQIEAIKYNSLELLDDLNKKRKLIIEEIIKLEAKLEKLKIPKRVIDTVRKLILWIIWVRQNK